MKRKLKIGVLVDQLLVGGVQLAAIEQVKQLRRLGHSAKLLILMRKKYPADFSYLVKGLPHEYLSDSYPPPFRRTIKFPIFTFFSTLHAASPFLVTRVIKKGGWDILLSLGTATSLATLAIWKKNKIPYIAVIHDPIVYIFDKVYSKTLLKLFFPILKPLATILERSFVKNAKATVIISRFHFPYLKRSYGIEPEILYFGAKPQKNLPRRRGNGLLSFGRWEKGKNPDFLLRLAKALPGLKLTIAGSWTSGEELEEFKRKIKKEGLAGRISLISHYTEKELTKLCNRARAWLHPHFEAFGLAALEAAAHGLPIIIPEKSGVTENFQHGVHGFFPKKVNLDEYKGYIKKLLANERLAYKMGYAAWRKVKENFSWEANAKRLFEIVKEALGLDKKPKIVVLETGHALGTYLAGGDRLMEPMALNLSDKYNFSIIAPEIGAGHWRKTPFKKRVHLLPKNRFDGSGEPIPVFLTYMIRMWQTHQILKGRGEIDVLYSSTNILPDILPAHLIRGTRERVIWMARIHHLIPPPHKREGRFVVNIVSYFMQTLALHLIKTRADLIIALNEQLKKDLLGLDFPGKKLVVLGAGIDFRRISSQKILKDTPSYDSVFLGRLHPTKGIFDLIPIWQKVVENFPKAKLAVIGGGQEYIQDYLQGLLDKAGLSQNIKLLGYLPDNQVYSIMKKAKVFLFADHEAGWGLAVAEAMACELPVVGYDIGILGIVFKGGFKKTPLGDYRKFADEVIKLLKNKPIRLKLAKVARKEAAKLDWEKTSNKFALVLERLAGGS